MLIQRRIVSTRATPSFYLFFFIYFSFRRHFTYVASVTYWVLAKSAKRELYLSINNKRECKRCESYLLFIYRTTINQLRILPRENLIDHYVLVFSILHFFFYFGNDRLFGRSYIHRDRYETTCGLPYFRRIIVTARKIFIIRFTAVYRE